MCIRDRHGSSALRCASKELQGNRDVVLAAVGYYGFALRYASKELKNNKDVVLAAVKKDGRALQFASEGLRGDPDVILAAVSQNFSAHRYTLLLSTANIYSGIQKFSGIFYETKVKSNTKTAVAKDKESQDTPPSLSY